ncbi:MAG: hypothetical protein R3C43_19195 [Chloroflexota bacterium]
MSETTFKIRWTGSRLARRIVDEHEWSPANGHVTEVGLDLAASLLTSPENEWELAERPKPAAHRELAERLGVSSKELVIVDAAEPPKESGPVLIQFYEEPEMPAVMEASNE